MPPVKLNVQRLSVMQLIVYDTYCFPAITGRSDSVRVRARKSNHLCRA